MQGLSMMLRSHRFFPPFSFSYQEQVCQCNTSRSWIIWFMGYLNSNFNIKNEKSLFTCSNFTVFQTICTASLDLKISKKSNFNDSSRKIIMVHSWRCWILRDDALGKYEWNKLCCRCYHSRNEYRSWTLYVNSRGIPNSTN
jgi:hypothetical protein